MNTEDRKSYSPYAPIRFQNEVWWKFAVGVAKDALIVPDGRFKANVPDIIMRDLIQPSLSSVAKTIELTYSDPDIKGNLMSQFAAKFMEQRHWVPLVAQYVLNGRQIFDLTENVVEMLHHTDFGDCTLEDWKAPYDAFFVRFGKRDDIKLPFESDFEYLDGAFISVTPWNMEGTERRIKFGFTTSKKDGRGVMMPGYFLDFTPDEQVLPIQEAIETAMQRRMNAFSDQPDDSVFDRSLNLHRREEIKEGGSIFKQAIALVVNVLFYLESIGENRRLEPGRDTPTDLCVAWGNADAKKKEKLKSKLLSEGYTTVYLLGQELEENPNRPSDTSTKRAHWRRGHWRRQRHGAENSLIKRIWMKPQMIGGDKVNDDLPGHIYVVGNATSPNIKH